MIKIPLNNYKYALIDEVDIPFINRYQWHAAPRHGAWYVQTTIRDHQGRARTLYLARLIMSARNGQEVDHKDHNPLNNARENLRLCTPTQNQHNTRARKNSRSQFKGVYPVRGGKWAAQIHRKSQKIYLGAFATEEDAAKAYDEAAKMHYGEFACLNFPGKLEAG